MGTLNLSLFEAETKIILEALIEKEDKLAAECEAHTDERAVAEAVLALTQVRMVLNAIKEDAVKQFGLGVLNYS